MPPKRKPIPSPLSSLTPAQIAAQATREVNASLAPGRAELNRLRTAAQERAAKRAAIIQGFAQAQAALAGGTAPRIADIYKGAAETQGALGQGFGGAIGEALKSVPGADPGVTADTVAYQGGFIPATALNREGAAFGALAAREPGEAMYAGQARLDAAQAGALEEDEQYAAQLRELATKAPELRAQIVRALKEYELNKMNAEIQRRAQLLYERQFGEEKTENRFERQYKVAGLELETSKYKTDVQQAIAEGQQPDASLSKVYGHVVTSSGQPILGSNGKRIPVAKTAAATGKKGAALVKARDAGREAIDLLKQRITENLPDTIPPSAEKNEVQRRLKMNKGEALEWVIDEITPILTPQGYSAKEIKLQAQRIVQQVIPRTRRKRRPSQRSGR